MRLPHCLGGLCAALLLLSAGPSRAADYDKYLPDDTDAVVTINVKQLLASPAYTKHVQKQVDELLQSPKFKDFLKDTGFDPLKDVERLTLATGKSCWVPPGETAGLTNSGSPLFIVQGSLDAAKLKAVLDHIAKENPKVKITEQKVGNASLWEIRGEKDSDTMYVGLPEKNVLVAAELKAPVAEALEKGTGKRMANIKNIAMPGLLARLDSKQTINVAAVGEMIDVKREVKFTDGKPVTTIKHETLAEKEGITMVIGGATVAEEIKGQVAVTFKTADKAKETDDKLQEGLKTAIEGLSAVAGFNKDFAPLLDALKSVKIATQDKTTVLSGQASGESIAALVKLTMMANPKPPAPPPPPAKKSPGQ